MGYRRKTVLQCDRKGCKDPGWTVQYLEDDTHSLTQVNDMIARDGWSIEWFGETRVVTCRTCNDADSSSRNAARRNERGSPVE